MNGRVFSFLHFWLVLGLHPKAGVLWRRCGREFSSPRGYWYQASGQALAQGVSLNLGLSTSHLRLARRRLLSGKDAMPRLCAKSWWCNSLLVFGLFVIRSDFCIGNFQNSCLVQMMLQNLNDYWNHRILEIEGRTKHWNLPDKYNLFQRGRYHKPVSSKCI